MFFPAFDSGHLLPNGLWNGVPTQTLADAVAQGFRAMASTTVPVVYHRALRTGTAVSRITVGTIPNVQRRRVNKVAQAYSSANV
jgi:hypothetical protein